MPYCQGSTIFWLPSHSSSSPPVSSTQSQCLASTRSILGLGQSYPAWAIVIPLPPGHPFSKTFRKLPYPSKHIYSNYRSLVQIGNTSTEFLLVPLVLAITPIFSGQFTNIGHGTKHTNKTPLMVVGSAKILSAPGGYVVPPRKQHIDRPIDTNTGFSTPLVISISRQK